MSTATDCPGTFTPTHPSSWEVEWFTKEGNLTLSSPVIGWMNYQCDTRQEVEAVVLVDGRPRTMSELLAKAPNALWRIRADLHRSIR